MLIWIWGRSECGCGCLTVRLYTFLLLNISLPLSKLTPCLLHEISLHLRTDFEHIKEGNGPGILTIKTRKSISFPKQRIYILFSLQSKISP